MENPNKIINGLLNMNIPSLRPSIRMLIERLFRTDAEFESFCIDFAPGTHKLFTDSMNRMQKLNLLLEREVESELVFTIMRYVLTRARIDFSVIEKYQRIIRELNLDPALTLPQGAYPVSLPEDLIPRNYSDGQSCAYPPGMPYQQSALQHFRELIKIAHKSFVWIKENALGKLNIIIKNQMPNSVIAHGFRVNARYLSMLCTLPELKSGPIVHTSYKIVVPAKEGCFPNEFNEAVRIVSDDAISMTFELSFEKPSYASEDLHMIIDYDFDLALNEYFIPCSLHLHRIIMGKQDDIFIH